MFETVTLMVSPTTLELCAIALEALGMNGTLIQTLGVWHGQREKGVRIEVELKQSQVVALIGALGWAHKDAKVRPEWVHVTYVSRDGAPTEYWNMQTMEVERN